MTLKTVLYFILLITFFVKLKCFQDCSKIRPYDRAAFQAKKAEPIENFFPRSVEIIEYDFKSDTCHHSDDYAFVSNNTIIFIFPLEWYSLDVKNNHHFDCVPLSGIYLGNNVWVNLNSRHPFNVTLMNEIKGPFIENAFATYGIEFTHFVRRSDMQINKRNLKKFRTFIGMDNVDLVQVNNVTSFVNICEFVNVTGVIRSKKVGDDCVKDIPVRVGNKLMFSDDGINIFSTSVEVSCAGKEVVPCKEILKTDAIVKAGEKTVETTTIDVTQVPQQKEANLTVSHPSILLNESKNDFEMFIIVILICSIIAIILWYRRQLKNERKYGDPFIETNSTILEYRNNIN
uniref:Recep_L_domain domain-containing protein n=1 Tax=Rhabditophanes sp. KR3021 TaxID=114890 RepID=A0AC35TQT8_9BILA